MQQCSLSSYDEHTVGAGCVSGAWGEHRRGLFSGMKMLMFDDGADAGFIRNADDDV
jgi:hypothetical protein